MYSDRNLYVSTFFKTVFHDKKEYVKKQFQNIMFLKKKRINKFSTSLYKKKLKKLICSIRHVPKLNKILKGTSSPLFPLLLSHRDS